LSRGWGSNQQRQKGHLRLESILFSCGEHLEEKQTEERDSKRAKAKGKGY
jgi:hypothetical protein